MRFDRYNVVPRENWQHTVTEQGMFYHTVNKQRYWNEANYYILDSKLVDKIELATHELHYMCMELVSETVRKGDYSDYPYLSDTAIFLIEASWKHDHSTIFGRFDFGIDENFNVKMFEYNADTPTSLLEASVIQWNWKEDIFPTYDQFNSIHEKLLDLWKVYLPPSVHFTTMRDAPHEDWGNLHYLMQTASDAGLHTSSIDLEAIGWLHENFVDMNNQPINYLFKLYPWEWMVDDAFAQNIVKSTTTFIEPPWKMLLSTKVLCARLWNKHEGHPNLLPSFLSHKPYRLNKGSYITKPYLGREGQGVKAFNGVADRDTLIQERFHVKKFADGVEPVIGSWIIGMEPAGIGIREDVGVTTNNSMFVPHIFTN